MRQVIVIVVVLSLATLAFLWRSVTRDIGPAPLESASRSAPPPAVPATTDEKVVASSAPTIETLRTPIGRDDRATFRGRCVDELGAPIAGVVVRLQGHASREQLDRYRMEHGEAVSWQDPAPLESDRDGRFEFRVLPAPVHSFVLSFQSARRASAQVDWQTAEPGSTRDVGDVVLPSAVSVRGRVVDEAGVGVASLNVHLISLEEVARSPDGMVALQRVGSGSSDASGNFSISPPLPPGLHRVVVSDRVLRQPLEPVALALPATHLHFVVGTLDPNLFPTITGLVVDARDAPIAFAEILIGDDEFGTTRSRRNGAFEVRRDERMPRDGVILGAAAPGFATHRLSEKVVFGARDVRIVLADGPSLIVRVRHAVDDTPVERFAIRLVPIRARGGSSSDDGREQHAGVHADGELRIERATAGRFHVSVVPAESTGLPESPEREIELEVGVPQVVEFRLEPMLERVVEVVDTTGKPVVDVRVEHLLHCGGGTVHLMTPGMDEQNARMNSRAHTAILCADLRTGADGRVTLAGHRGLDYALRLPGPGHVPVVVQPFQFGGDSIERVVVGRGATLRGRVEPSGLIEDLREELDLLPHRAVGPDAARHLPSVQLWGIGAREGQVHPSGTPSAGGVIIAGDGRFEVSGIPAGTWNVAVRIGGSGKTGSGGTTATALRDLAIAEGETRDVVLRLDSWVRRPVVFEWRVDGRPFVGQIDLMGQCGMRPDGSPERVSWRVTTDENGRAQIGLPQGEWTTLARFLVERQHGELPGPSFVIGPDMAPTHVQADLRVARRDLMLLDPDGVPLVHVQLVAHPADVDFGFVSVRSDEAGKVILLGVPGQRRLRIRYEPLLTDRAYSDWTRSHKGDDDAWRRAWLDLGTVDLSPGGGDVITLRLPSVWREMPK